MSEYRVIIPPQEFQIIKFIQEEQPGVATINTALKYFEPKIVFSWHLSIMLDLDDLTDNGMPSKEEQKIIESFEDILDKAIKGPNSDKPNALFLASIACNKTCELIWRVYDPEIANNYLNQIINTSIPPCPFDYRIDEDENWELAKWHLQH